MAEHRQPESEPRTDDTAPPANRAARRAKGAARQSPPPGGKVGPVRFDHATNPRQYAAHRRG